MAVLLRSYLVFLLVVNACKGQSQQANICKPSISADKRFPSEGENVTITVKTCPRSENSTISWSKCGKLVGTCVRSSCTADNIKNDQSELESTFTIEKSSNARDDCIVTFKTDDIELKYTVKIYKHPEIIFVTANGKNYQNIQVRLNESIKLDVKTSCMYPRPFIYLYYEDTIFTSKLKLLRRYAVKETMNDCQNLEVRTTLSVKIPPLRTFRITSDGMLIVKLLYGNYERDILKLKIVTEPRPVTTPDPKLDHIKTHESLPGNIFGLVIILLDLLFFLVIELIPRIQWPTCIYMTRMMCTLPPDASPARKLRKVLELMIMDAVFIGIVVFVFYKYAEMGSWTELKIFNVFLITVFSLWLGFRFLRGFRKCIKIRKGKEEDIESAGENRATYFVHM